MVFPSLMALMTHRPLDELHYCWQLAIGYVERHAQSREQLREAKKKLKQQLREFTTGEPASPCSSISSSDDPPPESRPSSPFPLRFCPRRPDAYPHEILWTYDDYKEECLSGSVAFGIRHADGKQITQAEWAAITTVVKYVEYDLLERTNSRDATGKLYRRADFSFYKWYHQQEWNVAVEKLEKVCPILGLCAYHWKAEMVLRWALQQPGDPHDPKIPSSRPFGFVDPNVCKAEAPMGAMLMSGTSAVKRAREVAFADAYPNKKLTVDKPPLLPQLSQSTSGPPVCSALVTASTSTCNVSPQRCTPTFPKTNDETMLTLQTKLVQLYKADLYEFVVKRQLASVNKRTLKKDLVTVVVNAALADGSIANAVDKMFYEDLPQKRFNRQRNQGP